MKIKNYNKYTPQKGDIVKRTFWLPTIKEVLLAIILLGVIGLIYFTLKSPVEPMTKEQIDADIAVRYEEIYKDNYKTDKNIIEAQERIDMEIRVKNKLDKKDEDYWRIAKEDRLNGTKDYIKASPEVVSFLIDFDKIESQKYASIDEFLVKNYPSSSMIGKDLKGDCKKNGASKEQCLIDLGIRGKESSFGSVYVKNDRTLAIEEGAKRNNPWGLKANRRYIDEKCKDDKECRAKYSSIPYDGFSFVDFNSYESGVKWFHTDTLQKGYPSVTNPYQMVGYYNSNPKWADDVRQFMNILEPLLNY